MKAPTGVEPVREWNEPLCDEKALAADSVLGVLEAALNRGGARLEAVS